LADEPWKGSFIFARQHETLPWSCGKMRRRICNLRTWSFEMAPRPNWKGYLKLSLVSCPVALYPATTTSERVSFRTLNRETGNRVRRQFVDEQTGDPVETDGQAKGYEVAKGEYIMVEDDELKAVQLESNHTIDIERFVPRAQIDGLYLDTPYFLAPTDRVGEEAFAVIREAMRVEKMVGLARVVLYRRERLMMLEARDKGIVATTLRYANEVHAADTYFDEIPDVDLPKEMLELAKHIIEKMTGKFDPDQFEDRYENALIELIRSKQKGMPIKPQPTHRQANVINLMDALRRSVEGGKAGAGRGRPRQEDDGPQRWGQRRPRQGEGAHEEGRLKAGRLTGATCPTPRCASTTANAISHAPRSRAAS
jgi:DNA end-binding protein Ku